MSIKVSRRVWDNARLFNSGQMLVMLWLADRAKDDGTCYPGVANIAEHTNLDPRWVRRILHELTKQGHLVTFGKSGWTNFYLVAVGLDPEEVGQIVNKQDLKGRRQTDPGSTDPGFAETDPGSTDPGSTDPPGSTDQGTQGVQTLGGRVYRPPKPSITIIEPSLGDESKDSSSEPTANAVVAGQPDKSKKSQAKEKYPLGRDPLLNHGAIVGYRGVMRRHIPVTLRQQVVDAVGDEPAAVARWVQLCRDWLARGWNPGNIAGLLDQFKKGTPLNGANGKGKTPPAPAVPASWMGNIES